VSDAWRASYYRTSAQADIDLVLEGPRRQVLAIDVRRTTAPVAGKGILLRCEDVGATGCTVGAYSDPLHQRGFASAQ